MNVFILWFDYFVIAYYALANVVYVFLLTVAFFAIARHLKRLRFGHYPEHLHHAVVPPVSVLISAYNEEENIVNTVKSLMNLNYPFYEIIVMNDGSTDSTLEKLHSAFKLQRIDLIYRHVISTAHVRGFYVNPDTANLIVVDKEHSGKSDSLNVGINCSRSPYFCSIDADSLLEKDAIMRLMRPIIEEPELVRGSGGIVRIINGCKVKDGTIVEVGLPEKALPKLQVVEYTRSFLFGRTGFSVINALLVISGTFSMFHKKTIQDIGGYNAYTVTEDMELVVRLHRYLRDSKQKYRIRFVPDPVCWTEVPDTLKMLRRQRRRWHTGLGESIYLHRGMLFNPFYGRIGLFALPYQFFVEFIGPLIEVLGYFVIAYSFIAGVVNVEFFILFIIMAIVVGVLLSTGAVFLEEITYRRYPRLRDVSTLMLYGFLENFGYRQLNALWRTEAIIGLFFRGKKGWEYVKKKGFRPEGGVSAR